MSDIKERLDKLKALVQEEDFLEGKGLSNEVNIRIFCYDPKEEMIVQNFVERLMADRSLKCHLIEYNLYKVLLSICEDKRIVDKISALEEKKGKDFLKNQLNRTASNKVFAKKMSYAPHVPGDVVLITGVGDVFPFLRVHDLLNAIQPEFTDVPILVLYPGKYDGRELKLFGKLKKNSYYRAFNGI